MAEIVICEFMDPDAVEWLRSRAEVLYDPSLVADEARLFDTISDTPALIVRSSATVDHRLLQAGPKLRVIGRLGVGLERFDLAACAERGVRVVKADGANALSVGEYVIAMTMTLLRRGAYGATPEVSGGEWPRERLIWNETSGKTIGIIGLGATGSAVAPRAAALGMRVLACDPYIDAGDPRWSMAVRYGFNDLLREADVVTLHTPLTDETRAMIDHAAIARMKPGAMLINAARGPVIDTEAVADALRVGKLGGAALDVFAEEPLSAVAGQIFANCQNLILTPHIAGVTTESNARVSRMTAEKTLSALRER